MVPNGASTTAVPRATAAILATSAVLLLYAGVDSQSENVGFLSWPNMSWPNRTGADWGLGEGPKSPPVPSASILLTLAWPLPALLFWTIDHFTKLRRRRVNVARAFQTVEGSFNFAPGSSLLPAQVSEALVMELTSTGVSAARKEVEVPTIATEGALSPVSPTIATQRPVLLASLEHVFELPGAKVRAMAGGLGKVVSLIAMHHPGNIVMVHPMLGESDDVRYNREGGYFTEDPHLDIIVDGVSHTVRVFRTTAPDRLPGKQVDFLLLSHPLFEERTKVSIYPNPMTRRKVLAFFSLWNQSVGALLVREKPSVFHCPDFHTAVAPWYAVRQLPDLRVLLVLHNAEYQGAISTDMLLGWKLTEMARIWNLHPDVASKVLVQDGRFNMLKAAVTFVLEHQDGVGVSAVSTEYAAECHALYSLLWRLPRVEGVDNPMLEEERPKLTDTLHNVKARAKAEVQRMYGLAVDPHARIFVSLGRLVRQKGVDVLADVAPWLLETFPNAQLIVLGPPGDAFGAYAAEKLGTLFRPGGIYEGRGYVRCEFVRVGAELRFAADFCLMPSRDEPFGYVDVEFAWHGALLVGAEAGGLGKVPGFYYIAQNRENLTRLRRELKQAIASAMQATEAELDQLRRLASECQFPLKAWQKRLHELYREVRAVRTPRTAKLPPPPPPPAPAVAAGARRRRSSREVYERSGSRVQSLLRTPADGEEGTTSFWVSAESSLASGGRFEVEAQRSCGTMASEFLRQELAEEEIAQRVQQKVQVDPDVEIDEVLETIGAEENERVEKVGSWSRWLAGSYGKSARVHWLVAIGYISAPVIECLCFVAATEWGIRAKGIQLDIVQIEDPAYVSMALFTINSLAYAIGAPIWTKLAMYVQPRCLLAAAQLLRLLLLAAVFPVQPSFVLACILMAVQGLVSSASMLFMVFNFMLSIQADMSKAAIRLGILEVVRYCVAWVLTGYVFLASPSSRSGTAEKPLPTSVLLLLMPVVVCLLITSVVPGMLLLAAPGPYKEDRFPGWDLGLVWKRKSFIFLSLSDCVGSLGLYPGAAYVAWWVDNGWTEEQLALSSVLIGILLGVGMSLWALALNKASVHGMSFLVGIVLLMAPPVLLRALVVEEVSTKISLGRSQAAMTLIAFSLLLEGIRNSATWTARIRVLGSRWRLLSYGTVALTVAHWMSVFSPALCEFWAKKFYAVSFVSRNQKELADATIVCLVPICIAQFLLQVLAAPFIHSDLGLGGREEQAGCWQSVRRTLSSRYAFVVGACLSVGVGLLAKAMLDKAIPLELMHHCPEDLQPECTLIFDESSTQKATIDSWTYGPNKYGQSTTGRYNCHRRMRNLNGDTFRFWDYGHCQVFDCRGGRLVENRTANEGGLQGEVWSRLCSNSGQNLVAVHLFEWPWRDVAHECRAYLGPAGVSMVQVSPPAEHILGDSWTIRYQPVSYKLESRSGSREEFVEMVAACTEAGVHVMVDAVVNHMAGPFVYSPEQDRGKQCGHDKNTSETSTAPCVGWFGTEYSDRYFPNGDPGRDLFERRHFHHYPDNDRANCGLPPWTNDNYLCDLSGLPDLDTESLETQSMITGYLLELYEIGVTMLRVDAAMMMYPESLHQILDPIPWQYIVQEYYPGNLASSRSRSRVFEIGSVTEFVFGQRVAEAMFDSGNPNIGYTNRSYALHELMLIADEPFEGCVYTICKSPVPSGSALIFLDNHDSQRERWKPDEEPFTKPDAVCDWNGINPGICRPIYKHGMQYNLAQRFMLVWPYGDAARVISSYAWATFEEGPPGVPKDSMRQNTPPVACGGTPRESPVLPENDHGWVCEHRWQGLLAMIRLRRLLGYGHKVHSTWSDRDGFIAFSRGQVAFFALSRGWNWWTKMGSNATLNLTGFQTPLPAGLYCNLALELGPLPEPERWSTECTGGDPLEVDDEGKILVGMVEPGDMVAIHVNYTTGTRPGPASAEVTGGREI